VVKEKLTRSSWNVYETGSVEAHYCVNHQRIKNGPRQSMTVGSGKFLITRIMDGLHLDVDRN